MLHGIMTIASGALEPLAKGALMPLQIVRLGAGWQAQAARKFLGDHRRGVAAEHNVDLVLAGVEIVEQPLGV